jgi:hypothetical protein
MLKGEKKMKVKANVKAGRIAFNHHQAVKGLRVKSKVRAGGINLANHNQAVKGLRVKSSVKAGGINLSNHSQTVAR